MILAIFSLAYVSYLQHVESNISVLEAELVDSQPLFSLLSLAETLCFQVTQVITFTSDVDPNVGITSIVF